MKVKWIACLAGLGLLFSLVACGAQPSDTAGGGETPTTVGDTRGGPTPVYPECDPDFLAAASLVSPTHRSVVSSLQPMFEWASPGYTLNPPQEGTNLCSTAAFHLYLSSGPYFQDELGGQSYGVPPFETLYTVIWSPDVPLEPGREYRWSVRPISQGVEGPSSEVRTFYTGPACDSDILSAPLPLSPLNYWVVDDPSTLQLTWWYPEACLPDHYLVEISPMLQFEGNQLNQATSGPGTSVHAAGPYQDCQQYFWRVRAVVGAHEGPPSQVYNFRIDLTGTCPASGFASIQGTVWEDQCAGPDVGTPMPDPLPLGCVYTAEDTLFTNQTYDPGEPGIPGVIVSLGQGPCPSAVVSREVPTWQDGMYDFYLVPAGTYCVSVDTKHPWNTPVLLPGGFTVPEDAVGNAVAGRTVTVGVGEELKGIDFGWWYKYGSAWGSTDATVFGQVWHDMCAYTPGDPVPDPLPVGCVLEGGTVKADALKQEDEPGIPDVIVDIGPGACPSAGLATAVTNLDGYYVFSGLPAGDYCLRVDPAHGSPNEDVLMPGHWTVVPSGHEGMTFRAITLAANHTLSGQDFGWDFDNLPAVPNFNLDINAFCREGPDIRYREITSAQAGKSFEILGRNAEHTWYFVHLMENMNCWFSGDVGTLTGDISNLRVFYGPLLPTDTPPPVCSDYKDRTSCMANPACTWAFSAAGPGYCKVK